MKQAHSNNAGCLSLILSTHLNLLTMHLGSILLKASPSNPPKWDGTLGGSAYCDEGVNATAPSVPPQL